MNNVGWHYVMSSRCHTYAIKESLTGKPPKDEDNTISSFVLSCPTAVQYDGNKHFRISGWGNKGDYAYEDVAGKSVWLPTDKSTNLLWAAKRGMLDQIN